METSSEDAVLQGVDALAASVKPGGRDPYFVKETGSLPADMWPTNTSEQFHMEAVVSNGASSSAVAQFTAHCHAPILRMASTSPYKCMHADMRGSQPACTLFSHVS